MSVLAAGSRGELVADPGDRGPHLAQVAALPLDLQITVPAGAQVQPLHQCTHEGEVAGVQLAAAGGKGG